MYEFSSRIRYSETDSSGGLTFESLIDYFQDCSTFQTHAIGAGLEFLKEQHLIWVVNSWQIDLLRMPRLYESVIIGTIPYQLKGFTGLRNFYMKSAEGEMLAMANSVWTLMDLSTMYPARIDKDHAAHYEIGEKLAMTYLDRKITLPAEGGIAADSVTVHRHHLDSNDHVNNGQYVRIARDVLEEAQAKGLLKTGSFRATGRLRAEYKQQARLGDVLDPVIFSYGGASDDEMRIAIDLRLKGASCCVVELS